MNFIFQTVPSYFSQLYLLTTQVFFLEGTEPSKFIKELNKELIKVSNWLKSKKLTLNVKKTSYTVFHRSRIKLNKRWAIMIDSKNIEKVQTFKFLELF